MYFEPLITTFNDYVIVAFLIAIINSINGAALSQTMHRQKYRNICFEDERRSKVTLDKQTEVGTCSRTMINDVISAFGIIEKTLMRFLLFTPGLLNSFQVELQIGHNVKLRWTFLICLTAVSSADNEVQNNQYCFNN